MRVPSHDRLDERAAGRQPAEFSIFSARGAAPMGAISYQFKSKYARQRDAAGR